ncbi:hypothetical protein MRX96_053313 [Rhipicephalus microplus]
MTFTPRLPAHAPATPVWCRGVCTFVRKGLTLIKLDRFLDCDTALELCAVEVVIGRKKQESVFLAKEAEFELLSDPQQPLRIGTLITRDTIPDLVSAHLPDDRPVSWRNTGHNLGSDHYIIEVEIPLKIRSKLALDSETQAHGLERVPPARYRTHHRRPRRMDAKPGRSRRIEILRRVGLRPPRAESYRDEAPERTEIGRDIARHLVVLPLLRNIHPQRNKGVTGRKSESAGRYSRQ